MDALSKPRVVAVGGPTATGKTALSVALAKEFGGEIINADSMQVYKNLNVGTAKPTAEERQGIPHHLRDFLMPETPYSVADFTAAAAPLITQLNAQNRLPLVVGGTGLYISSLLKGVAFETQNTAPALREQLRQEAETQAAQIVENAKQEAERINQSAQTAADAILAEAQAKAENGAKERADKLVQKYLAQAQREMRQACDAEMEVRLQKTLSQARTLETIHGEMCDKTNTLQANWIKALDNTLEQLNAVKTDFYQHLSQWQKALYPREVKALAECYLELYRMLNVDKLLREEVVFQADQPQTEPSPKTVEGLHKLNKTLTTFLRHFEAALGGLGLYAYYPQPGELFDEMRHTPEDEDAVCEGKTIQFCIQPGIAKKSSDGGEDDVVIPAEVRLNP